MDMVNQMSMGEHVRKRVGMYWPIQPGDFHGGHEMRDEESKPVWLMDLCKNKAPGVILLDGDGEKPQCLDVAYEIGATMVENGRAKRLCVWSWQAFLWAPHRVDVESLKSAGDITLIDFRTNASLQTLERLNMAAKGIGKTFIVTSELIDVKGKPYETISYCELAMRISVEQGIDLTECAECIVSLREQDGGQWGSYKPHETFFQPLFCHPLKIWNNDTCNDEFIIKRDKQDSLIYEKREHQ